MDEILERVLEKLKNISKYNWCHTDTDSYMSLDKNGDYIESDDVAEIVQFIEENLPK
jgi:hypothetical protein